MNIGLDIVIEVTSLQVEVITSEHYQYSVNNNGVITNEKAVKSYLFSTQDIKKVIKLHRSFFHKRTTAEKPLRSKCQ